LVAVSAEQRIVRQLFAELLGESEADIHKQTPILEVVRDE
jgi:hypothetical protein